MFCRTLSRNLNVLYRLGRSNVAQKRTVTYRKNCAFLDHAKCSQENLKKSECYKDKEAGLVLPDHPLSHHWIKPECCEDECFDTVRFDDLYYFISDKAKKKYTRTWDECPKKRKVFKKVCCFNESVPPPVLKRTKDSFIDTACPASDDCNLDVKCAKICSPNCKPVYKREVRTLTCKIRKRMECRKFCTPFPSFSECIKDPANRAPLVECKCLDRPYSCEVVAYAQRMQGSRNTC